MGAVGPTWSALCESLEQTQSLAQALGGSVLPGTVLGLDGDLGAGKTTFIQGLAAGWGVQDLREVVSPTYALMNIYPGRRGPLVHIDLYRLDDPELAQMLGLEEAMSDPAALVAVEWAERLPELLPQGGARMYLHWVNPTTRRIEVRGLPAPEPWPVGVQRLSLT